MFKGDNNKIIILHITHSNMVSTAIAPDVIWHFKPRGKKYFQAIKN